MRYEARMKRIAAKLPQRPKRIIVSFLDDIFCAADGWSIHVDKNDVITKTGDVPSWLTPEVIFARLRPSKTAPGKQ